MKIAQTLEKLEQLACRVGENGLYLHDPNMTLLVTNWKESEFWGPLGKQVRAYQDENHGVDLGALLQQTENPVTGDFPGLKGLDLNIAKYFREGRVDLMEQHRRATVMIKLTPAGDYIIFDEAGEERFIYIDYVNFLSSIGAKLMASKSPEPVLSFNAEPGIVGFIKKEDPEMDIADAAWEDADECRRHLEEFKAYYAKRRRDPNLKRNPAIMEEVQSSLVELLMQISGYERNQDSEFNDEVDLLIEELFPKLTLPKAISFPIRGTADCFETAHPTRLQRLENDGRNWYVMVSDWDNGYSDVLGTYIPIDEKVADYLRRRVPNIKEVRVG